MSFLIEVIVDRAVKRGELLQTSYPPETEHCPLPSSERLVGIFRPIVQPAADLALVDGAQHLERGAIGSKAICDNLVDMPMLTERFSQEFR